MSTEYNSILLAKLSSVTRADEIIDLLNEMGEIGDPIFLYPIYQTYKKNKISHISHYFISAISNLNSSDIIQIAFELGENQKTDMTDLTYVLEIFDKQKIYEQRAIKIALGALDTFISKKSFYEYHLYSVITYLKNAGSLNLIENELSTIFTSEGFNIKSREYALGKWLEVDPKKNLQIIIDHFDDIKQNNELENLVAKVISNWKGTKIEELKQMIEANGGLQAKYIIKRSKEKDEEKKQKANIEKKEEIKKIYSNADLIETISTLREKINDVGRSNEHIGFPIFPQNETIFLQLKTANDEATLIRACVNLREIIQNLSKDLGNYGLSIDESKKLLPDTAEEDLNKSVNKLFLYLSSKKFKVDNSVFGLHQLNQIVGLMGSHPKSEKEKLIKKLEEAKLDKAYREEEWDILHRTLLEKYINSLNLLLEAIDQSGRTTGAGE